MFSLRKTRIATVVAALAMAMSMVAVDHADARRAGGFGGIGSRGSRTYQSAPPTMTAPRTTAPIQRSMTPERGSQSTATNGLNRRPGLFGGFGGSLLRGLAIGGLLGLLLGHGFGGLAGFFGLILQVLLIGGAVFLVMRLLRGRSSPAVASGYARETYRDSYRDAPPPRPGFGGLGGLGGGLGSRSARRPSNPDEIGVTGDDLGTFERMLAEVQDAYGREDYATLRRLTTPEMMSYFSEELGQNASSGLRNEVSDVRLLQGDVSESWREDGRDYATVAMRYASIDATRDRATGRVVQGDAHQPTESTEIWTFVREPGRNWLLSAVQEG